MALGQRNKRKPPFVPPKLQITSMMDMFTIILIFLLFSFSDKPETIRLDKDLKLPVSNARLDYHESVKLVLTRQSLFLDEQKIADLQRGSISGLQPGKLKQSSLYRELKTLREKQQAVGRSAAAKADKETVLFLCDRRHSFQTINQVIKTAALAGYPNLQFGVLKE